MPRIVLGGLAAAMLFLVPAVAQGDSAARVNGTVALKSAPTHLVTVRATRSAVALRVPGSLAAIRVGQKVELRGSTLRSTPGARVLGRNVRIVRSQALNSSAAPKQSSADDEAAVDEVEIKGKLTSLSPVTVESGARIVSCTAQAGMSLTGFTVGDVVEMTCDLKAGAFVVRKLEQEDEAAQVPNADDEDDDNSGPGNANDDEDDDNSGPGNANDDDDGDNSGPGGGDDD